MKLALRRFAQMVAGLIIGGAFGGFVLAAQGGELLFAALFALGAFVVALFAYRLSWTELAQAEMRRARLPPESGQEPRPR